MFEHIQLILTALRNLGRVNGLDDISVKNIEVLDIQTDAENRPIRMKALIVYMASDTLTDEATGKILYKEYFFTASGRTVITGNKVYAREVWVFVYEDGGWKLNEIENSHESQSGDSFEFAQKNNFFQNDRWGWLLLPLKGQIYFQVFRDYAYIHNHIVGMYHHVIVEFYEYMIDNEKNKGYKVAQATLPKSYANTIVVRHKKKKSISDLMLHTHLDTLYTEWGQFNKKYEVFVSDEQKAVAFELLHPAFMEKLEQLPFEVNIQLVNNKVCLYTRDMSPSYEILLELLKNAFDEMKM